MTGGRFFEDFRQGEVLKHSAPRTVHGGDLSLYIGLTGDSRPIPSSTDLAQALGFDREVAHELLVFHLVFGKTVDDISANAVANLGYADVRFLGPVYPGDTLRSESDVVGLRQTSSGSSGVVYVSTRGLNQRDQVVLQFHRWVLVHKRDASSAVGKTVVPSLPTEVPIESVPIPEALNLSRFADVAWATGGDALWDDYQPGQRIVHSGGMTIEEADHVLATRLYQNHARVHFDALHMAKSRFGRRLVYGGHVISVAHALARQGLENVLWMAAWNSGSHVAPVFAGDTLSAWTVILARAEVPGRSDVGALRMRLVAVKNADPEAHEMTLEVGPSDAKTYDSHVVLDLDWWGLIPRRPAAG